MFTESCFNDECVVLDEEALLMFNAMITDSEAPFKLRQFVLHALLASAQFEPDVARMMIFTIQDAVINGVESAIQDIHNQYDAQTGADRVEAALAEGLL